MEEVIESGKINIEARHKQVTEDNGKIPNRNQFRQPMACTLVPGYFSNKNVHAPWLFQQ